MGARLPRLDLRLAAWAAAAAALSLGGGLLVGTAPLVALDAALLGMAAVLVARFPYRALLLILLVRGTAPNTPLLDGITLVAVGIAVVVRAPRLPGRRVIWPLLGFLAVAILSTPLAPTAIEGVKDDWLRVPHFGWAYARNPSVPLYEWMRLASVLAAFCLAVWVVRSRRRLETIVLAILVSAIVPIIVGLEQFATGKTVARSGLGDDFRAVIGTFSTPGPFAFYLVLVLILAIVTFNEVRSLAARVSLAVLCLGAGACLLLTYTRSAWIAFALGVIGLALMRYRRLLVVGWVGLIIALVAFPTLVDKVQERFGDLTSRNEAKSGNSFTWRTGQWGPLLQYGYDKPLTGQGFGSYPRLTVDHFGTENNRYPTINDERHPATSSRGFLAHNDYVRTFVELGLPGLVLWVLVLVGLVAGCLRALRRPAVGPYGAAGVAVALGLIVIASSDNLLSAPVMLYAFAFCGAVIGAERGVAAAAAARRRSAVAAEAVVAEPLVLEEIEPAPVQVEVEPEPEPEPPVPRPTSRRRSLLDSGRAWLRRRRSL
jgi:O-antigen ligase